ncbi:phosphoribosyltransferase [Sodalinema gerasimenkoae]|uniref:phosphoribosyltransferase n=1 Tax=Sodalinema gerasimenkoae TaxID=2862348 RepID=UPI00135A442F|nr:phosphoribosyltransferase family protein [Sodalinema gerasimenkoae]
MTTPIFRDRLDAGQHLAELLMAYRQRQDVLVLGLPRGGVPVAAAVAEALEVELDLCLVRKLGFPNNPELAMGAMTWGGEIIRNPQVLGSSQISPEEFEAVVAQERRELERRAQRYRGDRPPLQVRDRMVILVDDGVATGATMLAAIASLESQSPRRLIVAVPLAAPSIVEVLRERVDEVICAATPHPFRYLGLWYEQFFPTSDDEVCQLLDASSSSSDSTSDSDSNS